MSSRFVDWCIERVDLSFLKNDISIEMDARAERFLAGRPRATYNDRTAEQLRGDVTKLTDLLVLVVKERDVLIAQARMNAVWTRVLTGVVTGAVGLVAFFARELFSRLK